MEPNRQVKFRILLAQMSHQQIVEFEILYTTSKVPFIFLWTWLKFDNFNCLGESDMKINVNSKFNYKLQYHNDLTLGSLLIQNWIQK
jgi:hypothetical protein